jgi:hypothetical protein
MHHISFRGLVFDRVISLGSNCEVTANLRRYFRLERAYPFDWWITPLASVRILLENKFEDLFNPDNLIVTEDLGSVVNKKYNLLHHHDFPRDNNDKIIPEKVSREVGNLKNKFLFLQKRLFDDCAGGGEYCLFATEFVGRRTFRRLQPNPMKITKVFTDSCATRFRTQGFICW